MVVTLKNDAGLIRQVKVGFSWTSFFFGPFPFFFRGMSGSGVIWIIVSVLTLGLGNIYLWFAINKKTAHHYLEIGYKPTGEGWETAGAKWGVSQPVQNQSQVPIQPVISSPNGEEKQNEFEESKAGGV